MTEFPNNLIEREYRANRPAGLKWRVTQWHCTCGAQWLTEKGVICIGCPVCKNSGNHYNSVLYKWGQRKIGND